MVNKKMFRVHNCLITSCLLSCLVSKTSIIHASVSIKHVNPWLQRYVYRVFAFLCTESTLGHVPQNTQRSVHLY